MNARTTQRPRVVLACCGNRDRGHDAFGPLVADRVRAMELAGVEVLDLATAPAGLVDRLAGVDSLVVADAVIVPGQSDQLIDVEWSQLKQFVQRPASAFSSHGMGIERQLELARALGILPAEVRFIGWTGCQIADDSAGMMQRAVERAAECVRAHVARILLRSVNA